ncbi:RNA polymerase sigma factor [Nocardioides bizhenqiangii]|uniref:Sigma-70 family RNA polymerase sigma factor n=1 Tax=Nocardioides bizhenqiangii TaxID=3095076 RepID=A0ABZ0ZPC7_9ACTN|nr:MULTISPECIES: sigma-70 family RNA polymerase sigma factor [unclassified Nocardioides]MDZ5619824.1 sigma-70 family RNA polymerase sigma factor [Nocardioides sp. HM23]WQQ26170.1 sigma-70 family RNA polymerase sigma factor [Nocardioides sp. HM61]
MNQIRDDEVPSIGRDPDLLEVFYREHSATVKAFFVRRVDDPHQVADLIADTFLAAMTGASGYRPDRGRPVAWLLGIARNTMAEASRRQARRWRAESRIEGRRLLDEDAAARIEERIAAEAHSRALYAGLAKLPGRDRALMELVAVDGMPVTEAAAQLGMKPGTARVRLHRSRARLQQHLDHHSLRDSVEGAAAAVLAQEA